MTLENACAEFLVHCLTERKLSPLTVRAYKNDLGNFTAVVGAAQPVCTLSEQWIEKAFQAWSCDPVLKAITIKRRIACVKVFVRWLLRRRQIASNPLERVHLEIKVPRRLPRNLHTTEICKLISRLPDFEPKCSLSTTLRADRCDWDRLTARMAIEVMTLTGVRVGELVQIRLADMNNELGQIRIVGKGNKERHVSFPDQVTVERLHRYRKFAGGRQSGSESDKLFINGLGRPANEQYIRRVLRRFAEEVELSRRVTPHMLRHTAATQLLEAGLDIRFVQKLLGHASITTTELYTHVADHVLRAEIARANVRKRLEMHR